MPLGLGAGMAIASGVGAVANWFQARKQRKLQKQMATEAHQKDVEMWNMANQYNAPAAQMERLKEAGLNPALVYGSGGTTGNTSTQTPKYQSYGTPVAKMDPMVALNILGAFQNIRGKQLSNEAQSIINSELAQQQWHKTQTMQSTAAIKGVMSAVHENTGKSLFERLYQSQVRDAELRNVLRTMDVDFYKALPKQYQWIAPMIMRLFGK